MYLEAEPTDPVVRVPLTALPSILVTIYRLLLDSPMRNGKPHVVRTAALAAQLGIERTYATRALTSLIGLGLLERVGRDGKDRLYRLTQVRGAGKLRLIRGGKAQESTPTISKPTNPTDTQ